MAPWHHGLVYTGLNCSGVVKDLLALRSRMSISTLALHSSPLEVSVDFDGQRECNPSRPAVNSQLVANEEGDQSRRRGRKFCDRCSKAAALCICQHVKIVVNNRTAVTILQHPGEKRHHLGSARIALLGLQNVELISIPEVDKQVSHRMRSKVPGSKRFITGRGGKKAQLLEKDVETSPSGPRLQSLETVAHAQKEMRSQGLLASASGEFTPLKLDAVFEVQDAAINSDEDHQFVQRSTVPPYIKLKPDAGLLFPSEQAIDLSPGGSELTSSSASILTFQSEIGMASAHQEKTGVPKSWPSQLIVLDGTWSKARRIFFENPWLRSLPHYRLPTLQHSRYRSLRREPKAGFLSTVESIVYALQLLEPETQHLDSLLTVFDSMIEDQMMFMEDHSRLECVKHVYKQR